MQQIDCNPQFRIAGFAAAPRAAALFLLKLRDLVREPRNFSLRGIAMHDAFLCSADQSRLRVSHRGESASAVTRGDRFLHLADCAAHARASRLIDNGSADGLTGSFLCGFRVRHTYRIQEIVRKRGL